MRDPDQFTLVGVSSVRDCSAVRAVWQGIRRTHGTAQASKAPVLTEQLRAMVETLDDSLLGKRDRALLLLGFAGAFRRSELVSLDREDLKISLEGIRVTLRRSKTDQDGQGREVGIPYGSRPATCPVRAVQAWLSASGISSGPLFRSLDRHRHLGTERLSDRAVALVVQRTAAKAGIPDPGQFGGHSLPSSLATSAARGGASHASIKAQTGHKSDAMVWRYVKRGRLFEDCAAGQAGL